ncbi:hypothetical protein LIA77_00746 [Sarocladium implicatum]|nr:hypothetical protein LIA77_00746 [Sarocladium implicatum]
MRVSFSGGTTLNCHGVIFPWVAAEMTLAPESVSQTPHRIIVMVPVPLNPSVHPISFQKSFRSTSSAQKSRGVCLEHFSSVSGALTDVCSRCTITPFVINYLCFDVSEFWRT